MKPIPNVRKGEPITADLVNSIIDRLNAQDLGVASPLAITETAGGRRVISLGYGYDLWCVFELLVDLNRGSNARSKILWDANQAGTWSIDADTAEIYVYDAIGTFQGVTGDRGIAKYDRQSGLWVVENLFC